MGVIRGMSDSLLKECKGFVEVLEVCSLCIVTCDYSNTPLMLAVSVMLMELVDQLILEGVDVNEVNSDG